MHESALRLLNFARSATAGALHPVHDFAGLQRSLGVSPQTMSNWKTRGVSKEGAIAAERAFGCSVDYILTGRGPQATHSRGPAITPDAVDQDLSHHRLQTPVFSREELRVMQTEELPELFRVVLQDASLFPDLPAGSELLMDRRLADDAEPGDLVLLRSASGEAVVRELREKRPGQRIAHAYNPAFGDIDMALDPHAVVAVSVEETAKGRRSRR